MSAFRSVAIGCLCRGIAFLALLVPDGGRAQEVLDRQFDPASSGGGAPVVRSVRSVEWHAQTFQVATPGLLSAIEILVSRVPPGGAFDAPVPFQLRRAQPLGPPLDTSLDVLAEGTLPVAGLGATPVFARLDLRPWGLQVAAGDALALVLGGGLAGSAQWHGVAANPFAGGAEFFETRSSIRETFGAWQTPADQADLGFRVFVILPPQAPVIQAQPAGQTVDSGQPAMFAVTAIGTPPLGYQWRKDGRDVPGAMGDSLSIASASPSDAGEYSVVVANAIGSVTSAGAGLVVQPVNSTALRRFPAAFPVGQPVPARIELTPEAGVTTSRVEEEVPPGWVAGGIDQGGVFDPATRVIYWGPFPGDQARTLNYELTSGTGFIGRVTFVGHVVFDGWRTVIGGDVTSGAIPPMPPSVVTDPASLTVYGGEPARFCVVATGPPLLQYQWFRSGVPIPGATADCLDLANTQASDAGDYSVRITNAGGAVVSGIVTLTVLPADTVRMTLDAGADRPAFAGALVSTDDARFTVKGRFGVVMAEVDWGDGITNAAVADPDSGRILAQHRYAAPGVFPATVTLREVSGVTVADGFVVTVQGNTPPVLVRAPNLPPPVGEGQSISWAWARVMDSDAGDVHAATVDWGDGEETSVRPDPVSGELAATHAYVDEGTFTVRIRVRDQADAAGETSFPVTVTNVPPRLTWSPVPAALAGTWQEWRVTLDDPGNEDTHEARIDWGDGTVEVVPLPKGARTVTLGHRYAGSGTRSARLRVSDSDGGVAESEVSLVTVDDLVPPVRPNVVLDPASGRLVLVWDAVPGRRYRVDEKSRLDEVAWRPEANIVADAASARYEAPVDPAVLAAFLRVADDASGAPHFLPPDGATGVSALQPVLVHLPRTLGAEPTSAAVEVTAQGRPVPVQVMADPQRRTLIISFLAEVPPRAAVRVRLSGAQLPDLQGRPMDLDRNGQPGGDAVVSFTTSEAVGGVLLVHDGRTQPEIGDYTEALRNSVGSGFETWDVATLGSPPPSALTARGTVVWTTGNARFPAVSSSEEVALATFLDRGGRLILFAERLLDGPPLFLPVGAGARHRVSPFVTERLGIENPPPPEVVQVLHGVAGGGSDAWAVTLENQIRDQNDRVPYFLTRPLAGTRGTWEEASGKFPGWFLASERTVPGRRGHALAFWSVGLEDVHAVAFGGRPSTQGALLDHQLRRLGQGSALRRVHPEDGATDVPTGTVLDLAFAWPLDPGSVQTGFEWLQDGSVVPFTIEYSAEERTVRLVPAAPLAVGRPQRVVLRSSLRDAFGRSLSLPADVSFTTGPGPDTTAPASPAAPRVLPEGTGNGRIALHLGEPAPDSSFHLLRRPRGDPSWQRINSGPLSGLLYVDETVRDGDWYEYALVAEDGSRNSSAVSPAVVALSPDTIAPRLEVLSPASSGPGPVRFARPDVSVAGFVDDPTARVTVDGRGVSVAPDGRWVTNVVVPSPGERRLVIAAVDPAGNATVRTLVLDWDQRVLTPSGIRVAILAGTTNRVTWRDSGESDLVEYRVQRRRSGDPDFAEIGTIPASERSYLDATPSGVSDACYRIVARDDLGNTSLPSEAVCPVATGGFAGPGADVALTGGVWIPGGGSETAVRPTRFGPVAKHRVVDGTTRLRFLRGTDEWTNATSPMLTSVEKVAKDSPQPRIVHSFENLLLENSAGFGTNVTVSIALPPGLVFLTREFGQFGGPSAAMGIYARGSRPGNHVAWDPARSIEWLRSRNEFVAYTETNLTYRETAFPIVDAGGIDLTGPPNIRALFVPRFYVRVDHAARIEGPSPVAILSVGADTLEVPLGVLRDPDLNAGPHLVQAVDEAGGLVNLLTGDYSFDVTPFAGRGEGLNLDGTLAYSSLDASARIGARRQPDPGEYSAEPLGPGWRYVYGMRLHRRKVLRWNQGVATETTSAVMLVMGAARPLWFDELPSSPGTVRAFAARAGLAGPVPNWLRFDQPLIEDHGTHFVLRERSGAAGNEIQFAADGRLTEIRPQAPFGSVTLRYDGQTQRVTDSSGRTAEYVFDGEERIVEIRDPAGGIWAASYAAGGLLVQLRERATGYGWEFSYDETHGLLVQRKLPHGSVIEAAYDTGSDPDARFHWGALRRTWWSHEPALARTVTYRRQFSPGADLPDRVTISVPSGRNLRAFDLQTREPESGSRAEQARLVRVVEQDHADGQPGQPRLIARVDSYDSFGIVNRFEDALGHVWRTGNDRYRITGMDREDGRVQLRAYASGGSQDAVVRETDWAGQIQAQYEYFDLGSRMERVRFLYPAGQDPAQAGARRVAYEYDDRGRLAATTDMDGNITRLVRSDRAGELGLIRTLVRCSNRDFQGTATERSPYRWHFEYDGLGRPIRVEDPEKNVMEYGYDAAGRLQWTRGPFNLTGSLEGPEVRVHYRGDLPIRSERRRAEGGDHVVTAVYDPRGRLVEQSEPHSAPGGGRRTIRREYDADGFVLKEWLPDGTELRQEVDNRGRVLRATGPHGLELAYEYDGLDRVTEEHHGTGADRRTTSYAYDADGRVEEVRGPTVDQGGLTERPVTSYAYDAVGNLRTETYRFGAASRVTRYGYNVQGHLTRRVVELDGGQEIEWAWVRDHANRPTQVQGPQVRPALPAQSQAPRTRRTVANLTYNCFDDPEAIGDLSGDQRVGIGYGLSGLPTRQTAPDPTRKQRVRPVRADVPMLSMAHGPSGLPISIENALGHETRFERDLEGRVTTEVDPAGHEFDAAYTEGGLGEEARAPTEGQGAARTLATYDEMDNLVEVRAPGPTGGITRFSHDRLGRPTGTQAADGTTSRIEYNVHGEVAREIWPSGRRRDYTYDALGRSVRTEDYQADGRLDRVRTRTYDAYGRLQTVQDGEMQTGYVWDAVDRLLVKETTWKNAPAGPRQEWTRYTYGEYGNLIREEDSFGFRTDYRWDDEDNLVSQILRGPGGETMELRPEFDVVGQLNGWRCLAGNQLAYQAGPTYLRNGQVAGYGFSALAAPEGQGALPQVELRYDPRGFVAEKIDLNAGITVRYAYDPQGQLVGETWVRTDDGSVQREERIAYDIDGNRTQRTVDGRVTRYQYARGNRLEEETREEWVRIPPASIQVTADSEFGPDYSPRLAVDGVETDGDGPREGWRSNDTAGDHWLELDLGAVRAVAAVDILVPTRRGGLEHLRVEARTGLGDPFVTVPPAMILFGSRVGEAGIRTDQHLVRVAFGSPKLCRQLRLFVPRGGTGLLEVSGLQAHDAFINEVCLYEPMTTTLVYRYDADGRVTSNGIHTFGYDFDGHLTEIRGPGIHKTWTISPEGLRASETDHLAGRTVCFLDDGSDVVAEFDPAAPGRGVRARHLGGLGTDGRIGFMEPDASGRHQVRLLIPDIAGNITHVVDGRGATLDRHVYNAWGERIAGHSGATANPYGFAGQRVEPVTGFSYHRARVYDPAVGRFTSPDPLGLADGPNTYRYARNNPGSFQDPGGEFVVFAIPAGWALVKLVGVAAAAGAAIFAGADAVAQYQTTDGFTAGGYQFDAQSAKTVALGGGVGAGAGLAVAAAPGAATTLLRQAASGGRWAAAVLSRATDAVVLGVMNALGVERSIKLGAVTYSVANSFNEGYGGGGAMAPGRIVPIRAPERVLTKAQELAERAYQDAIRGMADDVGLAVSRASARLAESRLAKAVVARQRSFGTQPGRISAGILSYPGGPQVRYLRRVLTERGEAVAGIVDYPRRRILVSLQGVGSVRELSHHAAHETAHWQQYVLETARGVFRGFHRGHELEANLWELRVDPSLLLEGGLEAAMNRTLHPAYDDFPDMPPGWTGTLTGFGPILPGGPR